MQPCQIVPFDSNADYATRICYGIVSRTRAAENERHIRASITSGLPSGSLTAADEGSDATGATAAPEASSDDDDGGDGDGDPDSDRRRSSKHPSPAVTPLKRGKHRTAAAMAGDPSPPPQENPRSFDALPDSAYLRESQLVQKPGNPAPLIPASASTLWRWVKQGTFPAPRKIGPKVTAWRVGDVRAWLQQQAA